MESDFIHYCGWDIGGAHLKFAGVSANGSLMALEQLKCPLWQGIENLYLAVDFIQNKYGLSQAMNAVTMTGELCDNFTDRGTGVEEIISGISSKLDSNRSFLYGLENRWHRLDHTDLRLEEIASANWYASAGFVALHFDNAVVIDFGSTTVDIVPIVNRRVAAIGNDDFSRLKHRELVYTGLVRTPISAIVQRLPFDGDLIPVASEQFANSADVYRILEQLPETADLYDAVDGGEKTKEGSARRLFRMIGRDFKGEDEVAKSLAEFVSQAQQKQIKQSVMITVDSHAFNNDVPLVGLGCGAHLIKQIAQALGRRYHDFDELVPQETQMLKHKISSAVCAPAVAIALGLRSEKASFAIK